jgi:hypothetical protein
MITGPITRIAQDTRLHYTREASLATAHARGLYQPDQAIPLFLMRELVYTNQR